MIGPQFFFSSGIVEVHCVFLLLFSFKGFLYKVERMSSGNDTQYLIDHGVPRMIDHMLCRLLEEKPEDPMKFVKEFAEKELKYVVVVGSKRRGEMGAGKWHRAILFE